MNKDYLLALEEIENEKGIPREAILETLEKALIKSYEKNYDNNENVEVKIDRETGEIKVLSMREVVEKVEDPIIQISQSEAKKINKLYELGDLVPIELKPKNFGRIAAQTARNIVIQKIKDYEREAIYNDFVGREKELINGTIQRIDNGNVYIDLGTTEGIVLSSEQVTGENYRVNDRMKFFIKEVRNTSKGPQVILSRSCKELIVRLFELEVPEIAEGIVEIYSIAREAGSRTKIAVFSNDEDIDPVGACVGYKGARVKSIVEELNGEKIDIILYDKDIGQFIANSLSPSDVSNVIIIGEGKTALVVVPEDQLSLSIGKEGQNVRLAAKLTNWKIDIIGDDEYQERVENGSLDELLLELESEGIDTDESDDAALDSVENSEESNEDTLDLDENSEGANEDSLDLDENMDSTYGKVNDDEKKDINLDDIAEDDAYLDQDFEKNNDDESLEDSLE